jgi:tetratricopeptide (TPR) repeat protein
VIRRRSIAFALMFALALPSATHAEKADARERMTPDELAEGFRLIEHWRVDEARAIAERAHRDLPEHPLTLALIAEIKLHMSDYAGATEYYKRAREAGASEHIFQNESLAEAARVATDGYEEFVGEHFIVRHTGGKDGILIPYALETLEKSYARIGELFGWRPTSRVILEIYPSASTLAAVSTLTEEEIKNSGTIALCKWNRLMVTSPRGVTFGYAWRDTIAHELTHLIIGGASANTVPIWLHEGLAKFAETAWRAEPGQGLSTEQQLSLREAAKKGKLIPFEKMHPSMAKLKTQEETALAFAEVFTFIEFLIARKGWEGMRQMLAHMKQGASDQQALEMVHGRSMKSLVDEWMRSLKSRDIKTPAGIDAPANKVVVKDRPDSPDDRLHGVGKKGRRYARAADLLYARGRLKAAQKELEKAYKETGAPLISAKLAVVALAAGDLDGAERAAKKAIEGTSLDLAGPNVTLAQILVHRGKHAEALAALDNAIGVNPFDPRIHQLLITALDKQGEKDKLARAQQAMALLKTGRSVRKTLGRGGLVQIDGAPFSRVFVDEDAGDGASMLPTETGYATGMVTPGARIELRPGPWEIRLVPPQGKEIRRRVTVLEAAADGTPQLIKPEADGS